MKNPPHANDYPILLRMQRIGLVAGKRFDTSKLDPALVKTINAAAKDALADISSGFKTLGSRHINGWNYETRGGGTWGTNYWLRAVTALAGLGANLTEDAIYPITSVDGDGRPYDGSNNYVLHFEKDKLPPAEAFWSLTLYDNEGFQVPNPLNRFAVGAHFSDNKLKFNADGSLDLYIQNESPGPDKNSNWLPAPRGEFNLALRLYSPRREVADGTWTPPPVKKAK